MIMWRTLGIVGAVIFHAGILLFGGALFHGAKHDQQSRTEVELLSEADAAEKEEKPPEPEKTEVLETEEEEVPDAAELIHNLEISAVVDAPELEAASLSAIEAALDGQGGGGDFGEALSFNSGGRIGGMGKSGEEKDPLESAFSMSEIDQRPRSLFQAAALYPSEMRGKKVEGLVTVIFVVDAVGKVSNPRVEKSTHTAFDKPAIDAVKQWKFEPAVKGGERVACKMRVPIRFQQT
ncbi:MAG TPA: energy transducer TonB [Planctomycetota bacterium]|nr:energy transducer TonB [Planctomycetota bacterium]